MDEGKKCCFCFKLEIAFNILGFFIILFGFTCLGFSVFFGYLDISLMTTETKEDDNLNALGNILFIVLLVVFTLITICLAIYGGFNIKFGLQWV